MDDRPQLCTGYSMIKHSQINERMNERVDDTAHGRTQGTVRPVVGGSQPLQLAAAHRRRRHTLGVERGRGRRQRRGDEAGWSLSPLIETAIFSSLKRVRGASHRGVHHTRVLYSLSTIYGRTIRSRVSRERVETRNRRVKAAAALYSRGVRVDRMNGPMNGPNEWTNNEWTNE